MIAPTLPKTHLSPVDAAAEGFRVIRREPAAALVWMALWLVWFLVAAEIVASGEKVVLSDHVAHRSLWEITRHFGSFAVVLVALFFVVWGMTTIATFRAVLHPDDRRFCYLRVGKDELRVAAISLAAFALVLIFGGAPSFLLILLVSPLMAAVPAFARDIAEIGAWATVCVDVWLCVRLSLIAVETFAERRFHLTAYWPLTRGRFWYLLAAYCLFFVLFFMLTVLFLTLSGFLFQSALHQVGTPDLLSRGGVLGLAGALALITAGFWALSSTLLCACQAHAYRAITTRPWG